MLQLALFLLGTAAILKLSWRSLGNLRLHGFYRFFGFELLWALILLNLREWFRDPLSVRQLASYFLGAVSIALAIEGFRLLRAIGRPSAAAARGANAGFENTTALVTVGAYRFIRHPLYASLLALLWAAWLKDPLGVASLLLTLAATGFFVATAVAEEKENLASFGADYAAYMQRTRRFVPFLF